MKNYAASVLGLIFFIVMSGAVAQDSKYYKDGPVTNVSYIKIRPGKFDDYMAFLGTTYKGLMEANKKAGLILSYNIYSASPRNQNEPDLILTTTYANMAALDKSDEADAVASKVLGEPASRNKKTIDRGVMRDVLGSELIRELVLK